jgi:hypothetical protein
VHFQIAAGKPIGERGIGDIRRCQNQRIVILAPLAAVEQIDDGGAVTVPLLRSR